MNVHGVTNRMNWWKSNETKFSKLAIIARQFLAISATSVASESAFSTSGRVVSDSRSSLASTSVEVG